MMYWFLLLLFPITFVEIILHSFFGVLWICFFILLVTRQKDVYKTIMIGMKVFVTISKWLSSSIFPTNTLKFISSKLMQQNCYDVNSVFSR